MKREVIIFEMKILLSLHFEALKRLVIKHNNNNKIIDFEETTAILPFLLACLFLCLF